MNITFERKDGNFILIIREDNSSHSIVKSLGMSQWGQLIDLAKRLVPPWNMEALEGKQIINNDEYNFLKIDDDVFRLFLRTGNTVTDRFDLTKQEILDFIDNAINLMSNSVEEDGTSGPPLYEGCPNIILPESSITKIENLTKSPECSIRGNSIFWSNKFNVLDVGEISILTPTGFVLFLDEVGIVVTDLTGGVISQPTVEFGINGDSDKYLEATTLTLLDVQFRRERFFSLLVDEGERNFTAKVISAGVGPTIYKVKFYFRGTLLEELV
jgi:hypothetical protein